MKGRGERRRMRIRWKTIGGAGTLLTLLLLARSAADTRSLAQLGPVSIEVTESIGVSDGVAGRAPATAVIGDTAHVTDTARVLGPVISRLLEGLQVQDSARVLGPAVSQLLEAVQVHDNARVVGPATSHLAEDVQVQDSARVLGPAASHLLESVKVEDSARVVRPATALAGETARIVDEVRVLGPVVIFLTESLGVSDGIGTRAPATLSSHEEIRLSDLASVEVVNTAPAVHVGDDATVPEGATFTRSGAFTDPDADAWTATVDYGEGGASEPLALEADRTFSLAHAYADDGVFTISVSVSDGTVSGTDALELAVTNVPPDVAISGPAVGSLYPVGASVSFSGSFSDPGTADTHEATWTFNSASGSTVAMPGAISGTAVSASFAFAAAGVYHVSLEVSDDDGGVGTANTIGGLDAVIVVFDPAAGFVSGGGWIESPAGAYRPDIGLSGRATFGFVSKYERGAATPSGNTAFHFRTADLRFKSSAYQWLVVAGSRAQYKGEGTINGEGGFGFLLTAVDGEDRGADRFRIKIWDIGAGEIVYDNQHGAPDDSEPSTALGGGSIQIHR